MRPLEKSSFLHIANAPFINELYSRYLNDPSSVADDWQQFFADFGDQLDDALHEVKGTAWAAKPVKIIGALDQNETQKTSKKAANDVSPSDIIATMQIVAMIDAYRRFGHRLAKLDPLGLRTPPSHPELSLEYYGFSESDRGKTFFLNGELGFENATLDEVLTKLQSVYCRTTGYEFAHLSNTKEREWLQERIEGERSAIDAKKTLEFLTKVEGFESYLKTKFVGAKRFGVEGLDNAIVGLQMMIDYASELNVTDVVIGMAHRGRLNVLGNVLGKPLEAALSEFQGTPSMPDDLEGAGDVKYHLGFSNDFTFAGGDVHLTLMPNPSHLEFVNQVVMGKARAKQDYQNDTSREHTLPFLLHGDAAFSGQGVTAEALMMSNIEGYRVGGTIHIITNNQVGFTTNPEDGRSGIYSSDPGLAVNIPIIHVNADDVESVIHAGRVAVAFRQQFGRDVIIDVIGYRRHGHNESDEPTFTQPKMYSIIKDHPNAREIYAQQTVASGALSQEQVDQMATDYKATLDAAFEASKSYKPNDADWLEGSWSETEYVSINASSEALQVDTGIDAKTIQTLGHKLASIPADFDINKKIKRQFDAKVKMLETGEGVDWSLGEALAYASLLDEGYHVRMSGQDAWRGTFSHRHAVLRDQSNENTYSPLANISDNQGRFEIYNSLLSEAGVLGFEYGYSLCDPKNLVIWEAQFGDFSNGAQVMIDQFIASAESKWLRMSGLVMLLPHGYEGQGPEHSSARLERYLQLCAENNMQVINCTTPANIFHALRRQMVRKSRKPLIVMSPKSLLRHPRCISTLKDFEKGTEFLPLIEDANATKNAKKIDRVVFCSGKVYYDLLDAQEQNKADNVAILRLEQLYPFPHERVEKALANFKNATMVWCQEEPRNMGGWTHVDPFFEQSLQAIGAKQSRLQFVGRPAAASPATGFASRHKAEQEQLVNEALGV